MARARRYRGMGTGVPGKAVALLLVLAAAAAAMESAPKVVVLGPGGPRAGSLADTGPLGASRLAVALAEKGARIGMGLEPPSGVEAVVYLVTGPAVCGQAEAAEVASAASAAAARGLRVGVLIAAGGEHDCGYMVAEALGAPPLAVMGQGSGVYLVAAALPEGGVLLALYNPDLLAPAGGWRVLAQAVPAQGGEAPAPGLLEAEARGVRLMLVPDWKVFTNTMVEAMEAAGLRPGDTAAALVARLAGGIGPGVAVVQPPLLYQSQAPPAAALLQPGVFLAAMLKAYSGFEAALLQQVYRSPILWAIAAWTAAALVAIAVQVSMGGSEEQIRERRGV